MIIEAINDELLERKALTIIEMDEITKEINKSNSEFTNTKDNIKNAIDKTKRLQVEKTYKYSTKNKSEDISTETDDFILEANQKIKKLNIEHIPDDTYRELAESEITELFNIITKKIYKKDLANNDIAYYILNLLFLSKIYDIINNMDITYKQKKDLFEALPKLSKTICGEKVYPDINEPMHEEPTNRLLIMLDYFQQSLSPGKNVLRQKPKEEYSTSSKFWPLTENISNTVDSDDELDPKDKHNLDEQFRLANDKSPKILVIYDRILSFCKYVRKSEMPQETLKNLINKITKGVVIGIREKLDINSKADNEWLDILGRSIAEKNKERCIVIITADALRESGIDITVNGSLEQAVHQVVQCLNTTLIHTLFENVCRHLVVVFRETLVVHVTLAKIVRQGGNGAVHICPNFKRVMQAQESTYGKMPGKFSIMLSAIVKKLYHNPPEIAENNLLLLHESLIEAIPLGIAACNFFFDKGFCNTGSDSDERDDIAPFDAFIDSLSYKRRKKLFDETSKKQEFKISTLNFVIQKAGPKFFAVNEKVDRHPDNTPWNRIDELFKAYNKKYSNKKTDKDLLYTFTSPTPATARVLTLGGGG